MEPIVSPDPDPFSRAPRNGHPLDLLSEVAIDTRTPYEAWSDAVTSDPAPYSAELIDQQTRIVDAELDTLLAEEAHLPGEHSSVIPGFEALTWEDLAEARRIGDKLNAEHLPAACPPWCVYADTATHTDGFDTDPDTSAHRGVRHTLDITHGGSTFDHDSGAAIVTLQLEQDRDRGTSPRIALGVDIDGIEYTVYLGTTETHALQHALTTLLNA